MLLVSDQTVREMHANHALRQPRRPGRLEWHVAIPQGRVEEQANTPQATAICFLTLEHQDAAIDFHLFFVKNVQKSFQRRFRHDVLHRM